MVVYKITNNINGKFYIGQTIRTIEERFKEHCKESRSKVSILTNSIIKYGKNNFSIELIFTAKNIEELNQKEKYFIKEYNCMHPIGYNLTDGGFNYINSEITKEKKRLANIGLKKSKEVCDKISIAKKGVKVTKFVKYSQKLGKLLANLYEKNKTGVNYCQRDHNYKAYIHIDGKLTSKVFTINLLGEEKALSMAIDYRKNLEKVAEKYYTEQIKLNSNNKKCV